MFEFFLLLILVNFVSGLPPIMSRTQQPVEKDILFKTSALGDKHQPFEIQCDAEGDPLPK